MDNFQSIESGEGLLKQNYSQGDEKPQLAALTRRRKKQEEKIKSQLNDASLTGEQEFDEEKES